MGTNNLIKPIGKWLSGIALLVLSFGVVQAFDENVDHIIAIVNDDVIVRSELDAKLYPVIQNIRESGAEMPPRDVLEQQLLERLIISRLQLQAARQAGISVSDEMIALALRNIADSNQMTIAELREALESEGSSFSAFRKVLSDELLINQAQNRFVRANIKISDQEIDRLLNNEPNVTSGRQAVHIYHILIATPEAATSREVIRAKEQATQLAEELRAGRSFEVTARTMSDGATALQGGDLGWMEMNSIPTIFVDPIKTMERNQISDPIQSAGGFHIIKLADYKGGERSVITQTNARHILIRTNEITSDQNARTRLQQLKQRIENGENFENLARSHSDDNATAINGGELGWVTPGDLVPEFQDEMDMLDPGEVSKPFKTQFGWHIVQVNGRRQLDTTTQMVRSRAREIIRERKLQEELELWQRKLRDEAYVEIKLFDY